MHASACSASSTAEALSVDIDDDDDEIYASSVKSSVSHRWKYATALAATSGASWRRGSGATRFSSAISSTDCTASQGSALNPSSSTEYYLVRCTHHDYHDEEIAHTHHTHFL